MKITPLRVSELSELLGLSQPNTSKHIKFLLNEGIVEYIKLGKLRYYFIDYTQFDEHYYIESILGYYKFTDKGVEFEKSVYSLIDNEEMYKYYRFLINIGDKYYILPKCIGKNSFQYQKYNN